MAFLNVIKGELEYSVSTKIRTTHGFSTRFGGVSEGKFESLNLSCTLGDDPDRVEENYRRLGKAIGFRYENLVFPNQVHGDEILICTNQSRHKLFADIPYEADGLMTAEKNVPLIIFTADCVPILLHDPKVGAIAAIHSGWRGTSLGIARTAVRSMMIRYGCKAEDIRAAIGPCICADCYETGESVITALKLNLGEKGAEQCRVVKNGKVHTDLRTANRLLLEGAGLDPNNIDISSDCTSCMCDKYWSHRKTNGERGSQAAVIMMKG